MSGSRKFIDEPNHTGMRGIPRQCKYETPWLKESLKELFGTTYINKMPLLLNSPFHKNFTVKRVSEDKIR
ncbi:hypothetical protein MTR_7g091240 [Medicago truncatula]|uniref:Uncharacterized protein n=1 Tax=Medicago truncatula TaxID=3880 RepID=G7KSP2_MEDTR|nr:hypothetical protein MTR_7g091240 [Medicago truncatula]